MKKILLSVTAVLLLLFAVLPDAPAPTGSRWDSSICDAVGFKLNGVLVEALRVSMA